MVAESFTQQLLDDLCSTSFEETLVEISLDNSIMVAVMSQPRKDAVDTESCRAGFQAIIDNCIVGRNYFGGEYTTADATGSYSISDLTLMR